MKLKRCFFVGSLMVLFLCCYHIMNQHYDELARYQYVNDENRKLLLKYLSTDDINYLIDRQYPYESFEEYLSLENFNIRNVEWYNIMKKNTSDVQKMMNLVAKMKEKMSISDLSDYCSFYSFDQLYSFYMEDHDFIHDDKLVSRPDNIHKIFPEGLTLFTYKPQNLQNIDSIPVVNSYEDREGIELEEKAGEQLIEMCKAAFEINEKTCGNMVVTQGYTSFTDQEKLYEAGLLTYGKDDVLEHVDYPGHSLFQLGNTVRLVKAGVEETNLKKDEISEQQKWLMQHAKEYGFEFVQDPTKKLDVFILQFNETLLSLEEEE